jgi:hypothetical protein
MMTAILPTLRPPMLFLSATALVHLDFPLLVALRATFCPPLLSASRVQVPSVGRVTFLKATRFSS